MKRRILLWAFLLSQSAIAGDHNRADEPVPVCKAGDGRTKIAVWAPNVDEEGNLSSDPPQRDGQIVYIHLSQDATKTSCDDKELNTFSRPNKKSNPTFSGLAVNIRGNTQFANGTCYFSGYYMNEQVMGMHQGWIETYFGAVKKTDIILSSKFCLSKYIK